jgi:hypothetical protein
MKRFAPGIPNSFRRNYRTVPSPNGATVNSHGRKPLDKMTEWEQAPPGNAEKDFFQYFPA